MLIKEVCTECNLTKKAVEYYEEQGLIFSTVLENGYRNFSKDSIEKLKKISILRKLNLTVKEIKLVLNENSHDALQRLSHEKSLEIEREKIKQELLEKLSMNGDFYDILTELNILDQKKTIIEKLLDTFPGYYGRFISLHFSNFLTESITTESQQIAFNDIIEFLDNAPSLVFPKDLQEYLDENTKHLGTQAIQDISVNLKKSLDNPEEFIEYNKETLEWYIAYKNSAEYKNSLDCKLMNLMREFGTISGYYDIVIPAMRKLSSSYNNYQKQLEILNKQVLEQYPEVQKWVE
ncbi:MAG: MerR family transcriptional regulator [Clostridium sp.]